MSYNDRCHVEQQFSVHKIANRPYTDTTICDSKPIILQAPSMPKGITASYLWNTGQKDSSITVEQAGYYTAKVFADNCVFSQNFTVAAEATPLTHEKSMLSTCIGTDIMLYAEDEGRILWNNGETSSGIAVSQPGLYSYTVTNHCGSATSYIEVTEQDGCCDIYAPNAFSPNGDGINDAFQIYTGPSVAQYRLSIYDRWGGLVFSTEDPQEYWGGGSMSTGNYLWQIDATCMQGANQRNIRTKGFIAIIK
jgi:gliding motility-associated-like protein